VESATRYLIVNADDLGASTGINRGILEACADGVVTSASLMVDAPASAQLAGELPDPLELSVGLHATLTSEGGELAIDPSECRAELDRQLARFEEITGARPTHVDSHHNIHRDPRLRDSFVAFAAELGRPLREHSRARYFSSFYGQWDGETHLEQISVASLLEMFEVELGPGITELGCHPGYMGDGFESSYSGEREAEVRTLCDPRVRDRLERIGVKLVNFASLPSPSGGN
jgi:predicted glycoside hydrolase/deacetylase ChbG (UPF0249 family)